MRIFNWLANKLEPHAIPRLTAILVALQGAVLILSYQNPLISKKLALIPSLVLQGEVWRLVTFLFIPITGPTILAAFAMYLVYLMGTALEAEWGDFKYNLYLFCSYVATILFALVSPASIMTNGFIMGSIFLAFAYLNPDFELYLFFIFPIKIKYIAGLTWLFYILAFASGPLPIKLSVLASTINFFIFFGRDVLFHMGVGRANMESSTLGRLRAREPFHKCLICSATDISHPDKEFRTCSTCHGAPDYCMDHVRDHKHLIKGVGN